MPADATLPSHKDYGLPTVAKSATHRRHTGVVAAPRLRPASWSPGFSCEERLSPLQPPPYLVAFLLSPS